MSVNASRVLLPAAVGAAGTVGAVVGGTVATARGIKSVKNGEKGGVQVAGDVARESVGTGLSSAAGMAVMGALGIGGVLGIVGFVGVASGSKYLWDRAFDGKKAVKA